MTLLINISDIILNKINIGTKIKIKGWVRYIRHSKIGISFITIYDGSNIQDIQIIAKKYLDNYKSEILSLTTGCSIEIIGSLILSPHINKQKYEIDSTIIKIIGWINNPGSYPISLKKHSLEYLREVAHLRARTRIISSIMRLRHYITIYIHNFLHQHNFFWINTPIITTLDTEGYSKMFHISTIESNNFFNKKSFLTVSGQLNLETYACAMSKVYTFGPTFRAENSNTTRHLAEFWMLEIEIAFATLDDIISFVKKFIKHISKQILTFHIEEINFLSEYTKQDLSIKIQKILSDNIFIIDYTKAINILQKCNISFKNKIFWGIDLAIEHEKYLTNTYFNSPIIIYNYPKKIKPFYMYLNDDNKTVAAMDLLLPNIGEIIGGSQREHRIEILNKRILELNLCKKDYWWYRDLRKYGTVPHSGFGLGIERLVSYFTGFNNIKDIIPFPRTPHNAKF
ncbi:asparagine--tRNA ligase [Enterobacteriaceae endosymbiont of Neohaemonia nigricornis]|uniref:asparagine--tRNA ligase n=1 Tax=Enterobacteriaceae endosymbiont of Neohaemonia nigricornis TaxID=2675792 RepID=UPI001448E339|nr:asparagine--tRNA ligase [Enterobacteriaceae endosymbiont of Neohaemonia nigricornis]QJC30479.1 asparagine--tRNA ligase [Enterobacteriaceae endosymbiont of Neohaemonia nigricornis]